MTITDFVRIDDGERQRAFTGLLAHPLVTPWTNSELFTLVNRHRERLERWCRRLGYQLVRHDRCYRLRRVPSARLDTALLPRGESAPKRILVLTLLVAAVLEEHRQNSITLQETSDAVRLFSATNEFRPYDPEYVAQRRELMGAVRYLIEHGVLEKITRSTELEDRWQREGSGIGAGYSIHRDALLSLVDTRDHALSYTHEQPHSDTPDDQAHPNTLPEHVHPNTLPEQARPNIPAEHTDSEQRILRTLLETQALEIDTLDADTRAYLKSHARRLTDRAEEMTGGNVEARLDAWYLILPTDQGLDPDLLVDFPKPSAEDWAALAILAQACLRASPEPSGHLFLSDAQVSDIAASIYQTHHARLTVALKKSAKEMRRIVEQRLIATGLLVLTDTGWDLPPAAARYRDATLTGADKAEETSMPPTLFEEET